ncbi:uncharacterized protein SOCE26_036130 [Sorangium cellulosum]|uniref:Uncharacterized protein n=2 Tax=Sorangium cellulosum TaxID=56 RepID=A0A2L0ESB3_SORCE|nr:uncharacterized protein SOCE26_036130 [Sorangium cellulosum]
MGPSYRHSTPGYGLRESPSSAREHPFRSHHPHHASDQTPRHGDHDIRHPRHPRLVLNKLDRLVIEARVRGEPPHHPCAQPEPDRRRKQLAHRRDLHDHPEQERPDDVDRKRPVRESRPEALLAPRRHPITRECPHRSPETDPEPPLHPLHPRSACAAAAALAARTLLPPRRRPKARADEAPLQHGRPLPPRSALHGPGREPAARGPGPRRADGHLRRPRPPADRQDHRPARGRRAAHRLRTPRRRPLLLRGRRRRRRRLRRRPARRPARARARGPDRAPARAPAASVLARRRRGWIARVLSSPAEERLDAPPGRFLLPDGRLAFRRLLRAFAAFWHEHGEVLASGMPYPEVAPQLVLMAFLQRVVNGGGFIDREYGVGRGRIDLLVRFPYRKPDGSRAVQRRALELKVWRKGQKDPLREGLAQIDDYSRACGKGAGSS